MGYQHNSYILKFIMIWLKIFYSFPQEISYFKILGLIITTCKGDKAMTVKTLAS